jgi:hypothetical protein
MDSCIRSYSTRSAPLMNRPLSCDLPLDSCVNVSLIDVDVAIVDREYVLRLVMT